MHWVFTSKPHLSHPYSSPPLPFHKRWRGVGGTVKRLVARASLQATVNNQILTPHDMYSWAKNNIHGIEFFFVTQNQVQENSM